MQNIDLIIDDIYKNGIIFKLLVIFKVIQNLATIIYIMTLTMNYQPSLSQILLR